jgi:hypothetical protein
LIAPHVALELVRLCFYAAAITAYGVSGFIAWIAPKRLGQAIAASSNFIIVAASSLAVLSTLAWLPIEAAMIGERWQSAVDLSTLSALLYDTAIGKAWLVRLALSLLLTAALPWRTAPFWRPRGIGRGPGGYGQNRPCSTGPGRQPHWESEDLTRADCSAKPATKVWRSASWRVLSAIDCCPLQLTT